MDQLLKLEYFGGKILKNATYWDLGRYISRLFVFYFNYFRLRSMD